MRQAMPRHVLPSVRMVPVRVQPMSLDQTPGTLDERAPFVIRPDEDGHLDEVVARNVSCVHLERMSTSGWFLGIYLADGTEIRVDIGAKRAQVDATVSVDRPQSTEASDD